MTIDISDVWEPEMYLNSFYWAHRQLLAIAYLELGLRWLNDRIQDDKASAIKRARQDPSGKLILWNDFLQDSCGCELIKGILVLCNIHYNSREKPLTTP